MEIFVLHAVWFCAFLNYQVFLFLKLSATRDTRVGIDAGLAFSFLIFAAFTAASPAILSYTQLLRHH